MPHTHEPADLLPKTPGPFVPDRDWWTRLFASIDSGDAAAFVSFLTPDARFRFGNAPVVSGSEAIGKAVGAFFSAIHSSHHEIKTAFDGASSVACEGDVTYTRLDGSTVTFPFANVFDLRGSLIAAYRIYIDNALLFSHDV